MRVRSARTVVFTRDGGSIAAYNFLSNSTFSCSPDLLAFLMMLDDWSDLGEIARLIPSTPADEVEPTIRDLMSVAALVEEGSALATAEEQFTSEWRWGIPAAMFHFSLQDKEYMPIGQAVALQKAKLAEGPQPSLYLTNEWANGAAVKLPPAIESNELIRLMARRRTIRSVEAKAIKLDELSDCLFAGLGITGTTQNSVGTLPLSMTPSGGARNPFEAYVYARLVDGLEPGFYHYSAFDHTLGRLDSTDLPQPSKLMGGQEWTDDMPCVVFLCAFLERTMWKYDDANAYRVILIEAGHIGQNLMLSATQHGLSACPTAALNHSAISKCLGVKDRFVHSPIYALTLGKPSAPALSQTQAELRLIA